VSLGSGTGQVGERLGWAGHDGLGVGWAEGLSQVVLCPLEQGLATTLPRLPGKSLSPLPWASLASSVRVAFCLIED
jgi:hypothetical protein